MKKIWDIQPSKQWLKKQRLNYERRCVNRFFANLETRGGVVGNKAVLFCYNDDAPEMSYIITEPL